MTTCRTYWNGTGADATVAWTTPEARAVTVTPGARFTFDLDEENGMEINKACVDAGLSPAP